MARGLHYGVCVCVIASALFACSPTPLLPRGELCDLTSECDAPLVCRFEKCRIECTQARDCPLGSSCARADDGLGACVFDEERECTLNSDCLAPLVCDDGRCKNECAADRDCFAGARCVEVDDGAVCVENADEGCVLSSDCPEALVCRENACVEECIEDRDCPSGLRCDEREVEHEGVTVSLGICVGGGRCVVGEAPRCGCSDGGFGVQECDPMTSTFRPCECTCVPDAECIPSECAIGRARCDGAAIDCVPTGFAPPGTACEAGACDGEGMCR